MLRTLKIKNIALIDECTIEFDNGFNVLSGETGAGKSIIIDSINFVLGSRSDKSLIKHGADMAKVEAVFDVDESVKPVFDELGLDFETTVIVTRVFSLSGRNECRLNGETITLNMLKKIMAQIVDVFGQNDHSLLLDEVTHLQLLDSFADGQLEREKLVLLGRIEDLKDINARIRSIGGSGESRERTKDLLSYQINEIENANLIRGEEDTLNERKNVLINAEKISNTLNDVLNYLDGDYGVLSNVRLSSNMLSGLEKFSQIYDELSTRLNSIKYELDDITDSVKGEFENMEYDENVLNDIEDRLDTIAALKRKYGKSVDEIFAFLENAKAQLDNINNAEGKLAEWENEKVAILDTIYKTCTNITRLRQSAAQKFKVKIESELKELGMKNAQFEVQFNNIYNRDNIENEITPLGCDSIALMFSANLGVEVKPIAKIISGGEMSRFMLGFKCALNEKTHKTYIFDEIDTGIGGDSAIVVAKKMSKIAKTNQVLCVTHLPQIACFSDVAFKVEKYEEAGKTYSHVNVLDAGQKVTEIARMIGANQNKEFAILHARQLIEDAKGIKSHL